MKPEPQVFFLRLITAPLRELTKKNIAFKWENRHQKAFEQMKKKLTSTPVMAYFDTKKRSLVIVDGALMELVQY
jgi:hypothetical protein